MKRVRERRSLLIYMIPLHAKASVTIRKGPVVILGRVVRFFFFKKNILIICKEGAPQWHYIHFFIWGGLGSEKDHGGKAWFPLFPYRAVPIWMCPPPQGVWELSSPKLLSIRKGSHVRGIQIQDVKNVIIYFGPASRITVLLRGPVACLNDWEWLAYDAQTYDCTKRTRHQTSSTCLFASSGSRPPKITKSHERFVVTPERCS